ncbi:hypothetical protein BGW38_000381 [Lunasporangiospora selenospora]|uniref:Uncharacterized protein n=1 Tax=Lunasporangiospora selenospora TaxID=979761 RepID=A0A9P6G1P2_9FUNG|nr:hypothetical protein BGW38_000381 [Lunasporangiospora selenospora]
MCRQINSLRPQHGRAFTTQQSTRGPGSITQWDVVNSLLTLATAPNGDQIPEIYIEAFHLDINVTLYNSKFKYPNLKEFSYKQKMSDYLKLRGQEVFETTYFVDKTEDRYNHSWIQYGFSSEDLHNMTSFILGGTLLNNGTIILQTPVLRANISDTVIGLLFMAALVMIICGFVASKDVPSLTRDPVTEVLSRTLLPNQDPPATKKKKNTLMYYQQIAVNALRRRRVANLTLRPEYPMEDEEERIDADAEVTRRSTGTVTTTTKPLTHRLRIDFEERDRDNSVQLVDFSNDKHNKSGELSRLRIVLDDHLHLVQQFNDYLINCRYYSYDYSSSDKDSSSDDYSSGDTDMDQDDLQTNDLQICRASGSNEVFIDTILEEWDQSHTFRYINRPLSSLSLEIDRVAWLNDFQTECKDFLRMSKHSFIKLLTMVIDHPVFQNKGYRDQEEVAV